MALKTAPENDGGMSDKENDERDETVNEQAADPEHPFDQTNGMAPGLEGDADSPEEVDKRLDSGDGDGVGFIAVPAPGSQMVGGVVPGRRKDQGDEGEEEDPDA